MRHWITIDPGISGTGLAFFEDSRLLKWITVRSYRDTWQEKTKGIVEVIQRHHEEFNFKWSKVFIEWPSNFMGTAKGQVAIGTGSILKLAYLIGLISGSIQGPEMVLISVQRWKGSLPKKVTQKRAEKFFKQKGFSNHVSDAVGIGQFVIENKLV